MRPDVQVHLDTVLEGEHSGIISEKHVNAVGDLLVVVLAAEFGGSSDLKVVDVSTVGYCKKEVQISIQIH